MDEDEKDRKVLRKVRKDLGLRQGRLAELAGIHRSTISLWENGKVKLPDEAVLKISRAISEVMLARSEEQALPYPRAKNPVVAKVLARRRREWRITQVELAHKLNLASDTISLWENGYVELEDSEEERLGEELDKLIEQKRVKLGLPAEKSEMVPLSALAGPRKDTDFQPLHKKVEASLKEIIANQKEIIEEYEAEIARLELLNKETSESKDREIQALREQLETKKRLVTIPPETWEGTEE